MKRMENSSPFLAMQRAETQLKRLIRGVSADDSDAETKRNLAMLRRLASEARLDIRDYELSETREEQLLKAIQGKNRLKLLEQLLLHVSMLFGPADFAELSAQLEQIDDWLV